MEKIKLNPLGNQRTALMKLKSIAQWTPQFFFENLRVKRCKEHGYSASVITKTSMSYSPFLKKSYSPDSMYLLP
jgi:hypothetical protein